MRANSESLYWRSDSEWWTIINGEYALTPKAPAKARASFGLFKGLDPNSREFSYFIPEVEITYEGVDRGSLRKA